MDVYQRRRLVALACIIGFVVLMIILISSCGSDEEPATTTTGVTGANATAAVSKADYINMADSICAESQATLAALENSPIAGDPVQFSSQRFDYVRSERRRLQNLARPEEDADQLDTYFAALDEYTKLMKEARGAHANGDSVALGELDVKIPAAREQMRIAAEDFGFTRCGQPTDGSTTTPDDGSGDTFTPDSGTSEAPVEETPVPPADGGGGAPVDGGGGGGGAGL